MNDPSQSRLASSLSTVDVVALTVGVVIGASVFETPALVAGNTGSGWAALLAWTLGGGVSIVGALCYAELTTAYPHAGGDYFYFQRAFGDWLAFLFAWARLVVIQTGSIALLAFVFGDYATELWPIGAQYSPSIYAALAVAGLTLLNALGVRQGKHVQRGLTVATIVGLLVLIGAGLFLVPESAGQAAAPGASDGGASGGEAGSFGMAMVFVLLTYGGWNEAAYLSAEVRDLRHDMTRGLLGSLGLITGLYLLVNWAYLQGLGLAGMADSEVVAADLMRAALGRDVRFFRFLGRWDTGTETPANALLVQGAVALGLVGVGAWTRQGFEAMVDYTAPVFWLFFGLAGAALFVLRRIEPETDRPFRVPLYPAVPLLFCAACLYMLWSSVAYAGAGALLGVGVLLAGIPLLALRTARSQEASS
ncbi:amino acid transporter [Salinibacter ruber]|uniref:APC family permease n=1 Tax=Salinibacter ruber TaxID=146919 RepID=UPI002169AAA9|nr:amino acid permease [Salinibacter ruber]MCS3751648.1 amino acid transporter [Salinibacter ruber]